MTKTNLDAACYKKKWLDYKKNFKQEMTSIIQRGVGPKKTEKIYPNFKKRSKNRDVTWTGKKLVSYYIIIALITMEDPVKYYVKFFVKSWYSLIYIHLILVQKYAYF